MSAHTDGQMPVPKASLQVHFTEKGELVG